MANVAVNNVFLTCWLVLGGAGGRTTPLLRVRRWLVRGGEQAHEVGWFPIALVHCTSTYICISKGVTEHGDWPHEWPDELRNCAACREAAAHIHLCREGALRGPGRPRLFCGELFDLTPASNGGGEDDAKVTQDVHCGEGNLDNRVPFFRLVLLKAVESVAIHESTPNKSSSAPVGLFIARPRQQHHACAHTVKPCPNCSC